MIVITGASDGLGHELAKLYKEVGKKVINLSRNDCSVADINIKTDLLDEQSIKDAAAKVLSQDGKLEALINCAGVLSVKPLNELSYTEVERVMNTNVTGAMVLTSALVDRIRQDGADVVNVASTVGTKAYAGQAAYGASKWAMRGFSANLQLELKNTTSRVVSFCPGGFKSKLFDKATGEDNTLNENEWMKADELAKFIKQILDLPKNMEVSEVIINRKAA